MEIIINSSSTMVFARVHRSTLL